MLRSCTNYTLFGVLPRCRFVAVQRCAPGETKSDVGHTLQGTWGPDRVVESKWRRRNGSERLRVCSTVHQRHALPCPASGCLADIDPSLPSHPTRGHVRIPRASQMNTERPLPPQHGPVPEFVHPLPFGINTSAFVNLGRAAPSHIKSAASRSGSRSSGRPSACTCKVEVVLFPAGRKLCSLEPLVAADLYLVNMFGNVGWSRKRQALRTHLPEASAWTEWQHQSDSVTSLPTGATFATNRGAEQGDVLGTVQSALVLGHARDTHLGEFLSSLLEAKGVCDEWFVDDG